MKKITKLGVMLLTVVMLISALSATAFALPGDPVPLPDTTTARRLIIHKYSPNDEAIVGGVSLPEDGTAVTMPAGYTALGGIQFEIYEVPSTFVPATPGTLTTTEINTIKIPANLKVTLTTNGSGEAIYGALGTGNGSFLVVEKESTQTGGVVDPFIVTLPMTNPTGDGWLYDVNVYPKNPLPGAPEVTKDVKALDLKTASYDIDVAFPWIIRGDCPKNLKVTTGGTDYYATYTLTDTLDTKLDYVGNVSAKYVNTQGLVTNLTATDFTASYNSTTRVFTFALTHAGMDGIITHIGTGTATPEVQVTFETKINTTAVLGTPIKNNATLSYTNTSGVAFTPATVPTSEEPEVHTGGLIIDKIDASTSAKLQNAEFKLARLAKTGETKDQTIKIWDASVLPSGAWVNKDVKIVSFYALAVPNAGTITKVESVKTNATGAAMMNGVEYGDYWIIEVDAPDGYNLLTAPVAVTVNATSAQVANAVEVKNSAKYTLPMTGGSGTMMFTMGGLVLIGAAGILLAISRKKKNEAE